MRMNIFEGRCIEKPEMPCICPLEQYCRTTDPRLHPPLTQQAHGDIMTSLIFGDPSRKMTALYILDNWRMEKEAVAITSGKDLNLCRRTGRTP